MGRRKGKRERILKKSPPGAPPGMIAVDPEAPRPVIRVTAYGPEKLEEQEIEDPASTAWATPEC